MKKFLLLSTLLLCTLMFQAQGNSSKILSDSLLGKPKYVKEYVVFLNNSRPYTFMKGDSEYGHAMIMEPENLRNIMKASWFETGFCRYINNETYYDKNRKITKETWYYKSGEIVDDYDYTYDNLNRLLKERSKNTYSEKVTNYIYDKNSKQARFVESSYKSQDEPIEKYVYNIDEGKDLFTTKFDSVSKTDSIFAITNKIWKKITDSSYIEIRDSVYYKKLSRVKLYDKQYKVIEEKVFNYYDDLKNKKIYLTNHFKYEYDLYGNISKHINFSDGNLYSYIMQGNGKIITKKKPDEFGKTYYTIYNYTKDQKLERQTKYQDNKIVHDIKFEYKGNNISKLFYLENFGREDKIIEPTVVVFKYKFDKQKNWTEIIKNVNGKDLYKWIREIEYY